MKKLSTAYKRPRKFARELTELTFMNDHFDLSQSLYRDSYTILVSYKIYVTIENNKHNYLIITNATSRYI